MSNRALKRIQKSELDPPEWSEDETDSGTFANTFSSLKPSKTLCLALDFSGCNNKTTLPHESDDDSEDIDKVLLEFGSGKIENDSQGPKAADIQIEKRYLNYQMELKRTFGLLVAQSQSFKLCKKYLVPVHPYWAKFSSLDLTMEKNGEESFRFRHGEEYSRVQQSFLQVVSTHDPLLLLDILGSHPLHVDSCLGYANAMEFGGHVESSAELVERAIYALNKASHPGFDIATSTLSYHVPENRCYYISLFKHVEHLRRKGAWRSGFEFCKCLLRLNGFQDSDTQDPLGMIYTIDLFAMQGKEYSFFTQGTFYSVLATKYAQDIDRFPPNFYYSNALAHHMDADATPLLIEAISRYPLVVVLLEQAGILQLEKTATDHLAIDASGPWLLMQRLYVERCGFVWKSASNAAWLKKTAQQMATMDLEVSIGHEISGQECLPLYRCIHLLGLLNFNWTVPESFGAIHNHDPFPPVQGSFL